MEETTSLYGIPYIIERKNYVLFIGAGSVITKDCDIPYGIYAGNPAKFIKMVDRYDTK